MSAFSRVATERLHEYLCGLDYFKDLLDSEATETVNMNIEANRINNTIAKGREDLDLCPIPIVFSDTKEYIRIWENLFYQEAKAQIIRSRKEEVKISLLSKILFYFFLNINAFFLFYIRSFKYIFQYLSRKIQIR